MKKPEQIIILEDNDISMFVAQGLLAPFEGKYTIRYFTTAEKTMEHLKSLDFTTDSPVCLFVNIGILLNNIEFIELAKKTVLLTSSRLFLLTSVPVMGEKKKHYESLGFSCCIEKPLTEEKFLQALNPPLSEENI